MKKIIIIALLNLCASYVFSQGLALNCNNFTQSGIYPIAANPVSSSNCPFTGGNGTMIVSRPNNGIYPTVVMQSIISESAIVYARYRTESLVWQSWVNNQES